jgi:general secretion pathway protein A
MYTRYFGLTEKPFSIAPDPHFLYLSELHREALAHLLYGIKSDGCLVLLTGEVGTGKTTVSRCLVEQLPESTDIALILNPKLTVIELLATICEELQMEGIQSHNSVKYYIDILNHHLLESHAKGRNTILIIDEAQDLAPDVLEQVRLLTNLETHKEKLLKVVLLGQPELRQLLNQPELSHVNQRITSRYHLLPLQEQDVLAYVEHRIRIAGGGRARLFSDKALKRIYELSQGIPRLINVLCDRALLGAYVEERDLVDQDILEKAGYEITGLSPQGKKRHNSLFFRADSRPTLLVWLILALLASGAALVFLYPHLYGMLKLNEQSPIAIDENKASPTSEVHTSPPKETEKTEPIVEKKDQKNRRTIKGSQNNQKKSKNVEINKLEVIP